MKTIIRTSVFVILLLALAILPVVAVGISPSKDIASEDEAWKLKIDNDTWQIINEASDDSLLLVRVRLVELTQEELVECAAKAETICGWNYLEIQEGGEDRERFVSYAIERYLFGKWWIDPNTLLDEENWDRINAISISMQDVAGTYELVKHSMVNDKRVEFLNSHFTTVPDFDAGEMVEISIEATKAEIISMAKDERCVDIRCYEVPKEAPEESDNTTSYSEEEISNAPSSEDESVDTPSSEDESAHDPSSEDISVDDLGSEDEPVVTITGDVNADGTVNSLDGAQVLKHDAELIALDREGLAVADVNGDGTVNSLDAAQILKYDAKLITEF